MLILQVLHPPLQDARPVKPGEAREQQAGKAGGGPHQRGEDAAQGQGEALRRGHHAPGAADWLTGTGEGPAGDHFFVVPWDYASSGKPCVHMPMGKMSNHDKILLFRIRLWGNIPSSLNEKIFLSLYFSGACGKNNFLSWNIRPIWSMWKILFSSQYRKSLSFWSSVIVQESVGAICLFPHGYSLPSQ